ncbi:hypothetical protein KXS11_03460 [Plantibacter flavus]|uniref:hypothetical protein n=1 Tax=Plantibacter flavus TaxID=150123 RepID=UPI003F166D24
MAAGDKAAAKGWKTYSGNQDRREGFVNDNETLDRLADEEDARKAADAAKLDASKIRVQKADPGNVPDGTVWISWVD